MNAVLRIATWPVISWTKVWKSLGLNKKSPKTYIERNEFRAEAEFQRMRNTPFL